MSAEFYSEARPKAAKAHQCEWCGECIEAGEVHFYVAGKWDGDFSASRMHSECETAWRQLEYGDTYDPWLMVRGECEPK